MAKLVTQVKNALWNIADAVSASKDGVITVRKGYYYRYDQTAEKFTGLVVRACEKEGLSLKVVGSGDIWKPFRGGATVAGSSHFFVKLSV